MKPSLFILFILCFHSSITPKGQEYETDSISLHKNQEAHLDSIWRKENVSLSESFLTVCRVGIRTASG